MRQPERVFLDWAEPNAAAAARWLLERRPAAAVTDFSDTLAVVPTRQAARRLREALAGAAPRGVLSPLIVTPAELLRPDDESLAGSIEATLAFLTAFADEPPENLAPVFPHGPPFRTFTERANFARTFFALRASLADAGLHLRAAARTLSEHPDAERWQVLAGLEEACVEALRRMGRRDREAARLALAASPKISAEVRRIVLIGVTDLTPLASRALATLSESSSLHILIFAPGGMETAFDPWGRPVVEEWRDRSPGWENFDDQVRLCARGEDVAATLTAVLPAATKPEPAFLEIGALDRGLLPWLRSSVEAAAGSLHDPEGESLDRHWLGRLLAEWAGFLAEASFPMACALLRNGAIAAWLDREIPRFDLAGALTEADRLRADHFPSSASVALTRCEPGSPLRLALESLLGRRRRMTETKWVAPLRVFLEEIARGMAPSLPEEHRPGLELVLDAVASALDEIAPLLPRHPDLSVADWLSLVGALLATQRHYPDAVPDAIEASGWLELPWSDAPHLVLAGFNQGIVPARLAPDPFLLPGIRERLGLPIDADRAARDAYFLARLLAMRNRGRGRVDLFVCQIDAEGSPGQPSPLLFAGAGAALPERVRRLFADPRPAEADPPWEAAWMLDPPAVALKKQLRVTGFREFLACPFEFYLRFGLEMERFDPEPAEMDARVFGTLVHETLEQFSKDKTTRDFTDAGKIRAAVSGLLDELIRTQFETPLSLPLLVQAESARQRLLAFADVQAVQRREGWRTVEAEITFEDFLGGKPWLLDGWEIRGKIDRIDRHEATGRWRVLDYKTSDKAEPPPRMHIRGGSATKHTWPPDYALIDEESEKAPKWWNNLQLPLYRQLLIEAGHDPAAVSCGYFNLPKAVSATGYMDWAGFDEALGASALRCARGVIGDLERGRFWPPNPRAQYPQNAGWFHPAPDRTVVATSHLRNLPV